jgi:hypothetical protein
MGSFFKGQLLVLSYMLTRVFFPITFTNFTVFLISNLCYISNICVRVASAVKKPLSLLRLRKSLHSLNTYTHNRMTVIKILCQMSTLYKAEKSCLLVSGHTGLLGSEAGSMAAKSAALH